MTLLKSRFTEENLKRKGLSERQIRAVEHVLKTESISNSEYQSIASVSDRTALRDLEDLVSKGIFEQKGEKKSSQYYLIGG